MVANINAAGNDLTAHAKRLIRLHPCLNITGEGHGCSKIAGLDLLHTHPAKLGFSGVFLVTACEYECRTQADDQYNTQHRHAGS
ncbi:hypothetical protein D9M71_427470 [compost metagenome]